MQINTIYIKKRESKIQADVVLNLNSESCTVTTCVTTRAETKVKITLVKIKRKTGD